MNDKHIYLYSVKRVWQSLPRVSNLKLSRTYLRGIKMFIIYFALSKAYRSHLGVVVVSVLPRDTRVMLGSNLAKAMDI
jgi:hypothetical protein